MILSERIRSILPVYKIMATSLVSPDTFLTSKRRCILHEGKLWHGHGKRHAHKSRRLLHQQADMCILKARKKLKCQEGVFAQAGHLVAQTAANSPASLILSAGIFLLGAAFAALVAAAIPAVLELRRTAQQMRSLAETLEREIPDTASSMRLTGLELSDAIQEVSLLSSDVTRGLQASARMLQEVEVGVKQSAAFVRGTATNRLLPALRKRIPPAKDVLEEQLSAASKMQHTNATLLQLATATKLTARRVRFALAAANLMGRAKAVTVFLTSRASQQYT